MSFQFLLCRVSREFISITCLFCSIYEQCFVRKFAKAVKSSFLVWLLKLFFYFHLQIVWWSRNLIFTSLPRFYPHPHPASSTNAISASCNVQTFLFESTHSFFKSCNHVLLPSSLLSDCCIRLEVDISNGANTDQWSQNLENKPTSTEAWHSLQSVFTAWYRLFLQLTTRIV